MRLRWPRWQETVAWPTSEQSQKTTACTTRPDPGRRPCCGAVLCTMPGWRGHCGNEKKEQLACIKSQVTLRRTSNGHIRCLRAHRDREEVTREVPQVWLRLAGRVFTRWSGPSVRLTNSWHLLLVDFVGWQRRFLGARDISPRRTQATEGAESTCRRPRCSRETS